MKITQKRFEEQHHFVDDHCRKNNLISGTDKYLKETYFDMLRTGEDTGGMEIEPGEEWHNIKFEFGEMLRVGPSNVQGLNSKTNIQIF
jgi:hypothetical protein